MNERLELTDTPQDMIVKMAEGNPGAIRVLVEMFSEGEGIDPQSAFGGLGGLLSLDSLGIYGHRIWMLYKDVCDQNLSHTLGLLRAYQLGIVSKCGLGTAVDRRGAGLNTKKCLEAVKKRLPDFGLSPGIESPVEGKIERRGNNNEPICAGESGGPEAGERPSEPGPVQRSPVELGPGMPEGDEDSGGVPGGLGPTSPEPEVPPTTGGK